MIKKRTSGNDLLILAAGCIIVITAIIYSNSLKNPFIFDDAVITEQKELQLTSLDGRSLLDAAFFTFQKYRPLSNISFGLNYYFHGHDVFGYHLVNIIIHIAAGFFFFLFVRVTLETPRLAGREFPGWFSFAAALIWLTNPVHTQSVTYIYQRMTSLAALFFVMSLYFYCRVRLQVPGRKRIALIICCVAAALCAIGSKENAVTLPLFILLYEFCFFAVDIRETIRKRSALIIISLIVVLASSFWILGSDPVAYILKGYGNEPYTPIQRIMTEWRVIFYYISLLVLPLPSRLHLDYSFPLSSSLTDPITTLFSGFGILLLTVTAFFLIRRSPLVSFSTLWFLGNLFIESSFIQLDIVYEHRTYLPSMGIAILATLFVARYVRHQFARTAIFSVIMILFSIWSYQRNEVWSDRVTFWEDNLKKAPDNERVHNNLGFAYIEKGNVKKAEYHFRKAIDLAPLYDDAYSNLGALLERTGRQNEAIKYLERAVELDPDPGQLYNLGVTYHRQGNIAKAQAKYEEVLLREPDHPQANNNLGVILMVQKRYPESLELFNRALEADPNYGDAQKNKKRLLKISRRDKSRSDT